MEILPEIDRDKLVGHPHQILALLELADSLRNTATAKILRFIFTAGLCTTCACVCELEIDEFYDEDELVTELRLVLRVPKHIVRIISYAASIAYDLHNFRSAKEDLAKEEEPKLFFKTSYDCFIETLEIVPA